MRTNKYIYIFVLLLIVCVALVAYFGINAGPIQIKGISDMRFGIDIRGGVEAVYEAKDLDRAPTETELESARIIMETRLDSQNILDREITIDKNNGQILIRFPWKSGETDFNPQAAIAELGETARLTFRDPDGNILVEGKDVKESVVQIDNKTGKPVVTLKFDSEGTKQFADATAKLVNQRISIFMDETMISSPVVNEAITGGEAIISNMGSIEEAKALSEKINSGALPFSLISKNHSTITPTLGIGALDVMVKACLVAFAFVCIFMLFYYRLLGAVACFALVLQVSVQLLALSIPQITLTLPGIAGIILSMGMGVDANVIISERIKEELKDGKSIGSSIDSGYHRAFSAIFDGNLTSIIVSVILMIFGTGSMLSFAYTLMVGCILNFVSGVAISRIITKSLSMNKPFRNKSLYGVKFKEAV
nr:protein translocase subunit SecD [Sedimentibacter sp.]